MAAIAKKLESARREDGAGADGDENFWDLRLYVAGQTPKSMTAFANLSASARSISPGNTGSKWSIC